MDNVKIITWFDLMIYISHMSKSQQKYDVTFKDKSDEFFKVNFITEIDESNNEFADILEEGNHFLHIGQK